MSHEGKLIGRAWVRESSKEKAASSERRPPLGFDESIVDKLINSHSAPHRLQTSGSDEGMHGPKAHRRRPGGELLSNMAE